MIQKSPKTKQETQRRTGLAKLKDAAEYIGISRESVRALMDNNRLEFEMVGSHRRPLWNSIYEYTRDEVNS